MWWSELSLETDVAFGWVVDYYLCDFWWLTRPMISWVCMRFFQCHCLSSLFPMWCNFLPLSCYAFLIFLIHLATLAFSANHSTTADFPASNCDQIRALSSGSENNVSCTLMNSWQENHLPFCFASLCSSNRRQPLLNYTILHSGLSEAAKTSFE